MCSRWSAAGMPSGRIPSRFRITPPSIPINPATGPGSSRKSSDWIDDGASGVPELLKRDDGGSLWRIATFIAHAVK
jgi:hypothetical protein